MNINTIRIIDRKLGGFLISIFHTIKAQKQESNKILIIKVWGIGSLINLSPAIAKLKKAYPKSEIDLLTSKQSATIYENNGIFNKIYTLDLSKGVSMFYYFISLLSALRKRKYDLLFDFEPLAQSTAVFSRIISAKKSIGFDIPGGRRKRMFSDYLIYNQEDKHISEIFYELLSVVKLSKPKELEPIEPEISLPQRKVVEDFFRKNKIEKYICININASELALQRRWPIKKFRELSEKALEKYPNYHQLFIGGPSDNNYVSRCVGNINGKKIINVAGRFTINESIYLLKKSSLLISNDSGPIHLAASVNCKTLSFFGPETPKLYKPLGKKSKLFYKGLDCSPCINIKNAKKIGCKNPICLDFSVEEVFREVKKTLRI